jgi:hypothetical protein
MGPGGQVGPQEGKMFINVLILEIYFKNLLKNHCTRKTEIYMKSS